MDNEKRIRQYKILAGSIFGLLLLVLVLQLGEIFKSGNTHNYELNQAINQRNKEYARQNPFGFTDKLRVTQKSKGIFRIAVLGDSFIWGDGLPYEKIWSHKLENKLLAKYDSIEVLSWGQSGWSTLDEFNFYKEHGGNYDIDLLIIGWVDNDADVGNIPQVNAGDAAQQYPVTYKMFPAIARWLLNLKNRHAYQHWMDALYAPENLSNYQQVLRDFEAYLKTNNTPALVIMTPSAFYDELQQHFELAQPLIQKAGFPCLNLYSDAQKKLSHYNRVELQANPVNGHPGDLMTEVFADDVKNYLEQQGYLKQVRKL